MHKIELDLPILSYIAYGDNSPRLAMIQMLDDHQAKDFERETEIIAQALGNVPFIMVGMRVSDWEKELTTWPDQHISKREGVGLGAEDTLHRLTEQLCPLLRKDFGNIPIILGGYSLGGLFSLWATRQTDVFDGIAAMSPSLWIKDWDSYADENVPHSRVVYLSLGNREENAKNRYIGQVGDRVRREHARLVKNLGEDNTTLVWNQGGHYQQFMERTAAGFTWCAKRLLCLQ